MPRSLIQLKHILGELVHEQRPRVLIIEDLTEAQQHLRRTLKEVGISVISTSASAETAMKLLKSSNYDIIFCDMNLPGMSGGAFLHKVRTEGLLAPHSLFFMVSGEVQIETLRHLLTQAPDEYIAKPFTQELLWRKLYKNLSLRGSRLNVMSMLDRGMKPAEVLHKTMPKNGNIVMKSICYRNLAASLEEYSRYEEAYIVYEHASRLFDKTPPRWIDMGKGLCLEMQGAFNKAINAYSRLLDRNHNNASALDALSRCYERLGQVDEALRYAWDTMMLTVSNRQAVERVISLAELLGDLGKLEESLYRLIRIDRRMNGDYVDLVSKYLLNIYSLLERDEMTPLICDRFNSMLQEMRRFKKIPPAALSNTYRAEIFFYIKADKLKHALSVKARWDNEISRGKAKPPSQSQAASLNELLGLTLSESGAA